MIGPVLHRPGGDEEPQRTNLITDSGAVLPPWTDSGSTSINLSLGHLGGHFNGVQVASGGAVWNRVQSSLVSLTATSLYYVTFWYKVGTSGRVRMVMRGVTSTNETRLAGTVGNVMVLTETAGTVSDIIQRQVSTDGIYQYSFGFIAGATESYQPGLGPDSATVGENVICLGCQVESGSFTTSLIKTTGSAATRY